MDDQIEDHNIALVVFSDTTDLWWLKFLKSGFRHCFVIIKFSDLERDRWVALDPMLHHWQISLPNIEKSFDLRQWLEDQGHHVVSTKILAPARRYYPPLFLSCVEVVKRILGLQRPFVITPYQLYRHLKFQS
ncbi:MAG TPA: hypothetical protein PLK94_06215 [Alphaproteobacteria bacterium]|nr:hypothetical protein [Alphaproteobacteria bacterium]HOO50866.1 hypothetical protein [Alphaproteobacteria bacterium]